MKITSTFGYRIHPIDKVRRMHNGLDIVSSSGKQFTVHAVKAGRVVRSRLVKREEDTGNTWQWGNYVAVAGDDGKTIYYCHLANRKVKVGDVVKAGDVIGLEGNTGYSTGIHLHFEVRNAQGIPINAATYLGIPNKVGEVEIPILEDGLKKNATEEKQDTFTIPNGAVYTNGVKVPVRLWGKTYKVKSRTSRAVLLDEIYSWVKL